MSFFDSTNPIKQGSIVVIRDVQSENNRLGKVQKRIGDRWQVKLLDPRVGEKPVIEVKDINIKLATIYDKTDVHFDYRTEEDKLSIMQAVDDSMSHELKKGNIVVISGVQSKTYAYVNNRLGEVEKQIGDRWQVKLLDPRVGEKPAFQIKKKNLAFVYDKADTVFDSSDSESDTESDSESDEDAEKVINVTDIKGNLLGEFEVFKECTIADLKKEIAIELNIPVEAQYLKNKTTMSTLEGGTLADNGITTSPANIILIRKFIPGSVVCKKGTTICGTLIKEVKRNGSKYWEVMLEDGTREEWLHAHLEHS